MIKALASQAGQTNTAPAPVRPQTVTPAVSGPVARVGVEDRELARQSSLAEGEAIKIVIHDVDCDIGKR